MQWVKGWPTWVKWAVGIFVALIVIGAIAGGEDEKAGGPENAATSADATSAKESPANDGEEDQGCGIEATDDCTPHAGPKGKVQVDGLVWQVKAVETKPSIGDSEFGLSEEANGVYLVAHLKVKSTKDESVSISDEIVSLVAEGDGNTYAPDSDGTFAASTDGEDVFFFEDIGPNSTLEGVVVYDVPESLMKAKSLELEFGELGFGSTKGYIALP